MKTREEILEKTIPYQQNKNLYVYEVWTEIHKAMQEFSDQENARLTAINEKQSEYLAYLKRAIHSESIIDNVTAGARDKFDSELSALRAGEEVKKPTAMKNYIDDLYPDGDSPSRQGLHRFGHDSNES